VNPYLITAALLAMILTGWQGYRMGGAASDARHAAATVQLQRDLFRAADDLSIAAAEIEAWRAAQTQATERFEDEARADPDAVHRRPSADSLRRLERLWSGGANPRP
jgi:hypothetical protein